ncbi:unnamed protein product [Ranitomeya imitator]|uniref:PDZ domain-containing protein n=1 Tax=Ranitomeya imitator TaxID=111125 RepID=A0ABN9KYQ6_9NEOB|nr:unnamed protein product [Ranitomeya imitator]
MNRAVDPLDPARTVIVVQSLLAGGVAEESGQILPGDRLIFVNDSFMDNASLEEAVQILTSAPPGRVRIGICKPLVSDMKEGHVYIPLVGESEDNVEVPVDDPSPTVQFYHEKYQVEPFIDDGREELVDEPSLTLGPAFNIHHNNAEPLQESWEMHNMGGFMEEIEMLVDDEDPQQDASHADNDEHSLQSNGIPPPSVQNTSSAPAWLDAAAYRDLSDSRSRLLPLEALDTYDSDIHSPEEIILDLAMEQRETAFLKEPTIIFDPDAIVLKRSHRTERDSGAQRLQSLSSIELPEREEGEGEETPTFSHWGAPRVVEIWREPQVSLGISIVGGHTIIKRLKNGEELKGIFIKQVLEDSPAGRTKALKTGDKILEVSGVDLKSATHEEAVEAIKNAGNPVVFVIQSLSAAPRLLSIVKPANKGGAESSPQGLVASLILLFSGSCGLSYSSLPSGLVASLILLFPGSCGQSYSSLLRVLLDAYLVSCFWQAAKYLVPSEFRAWALFKAVESFRLSGVIIPITEDEKFQGFYSNLFICS